MADERSTDHDPVGADSDHPTERSAAQGAGVPMERILAHLAEQPSSHDALATVAEPTWNDVRTVMASAGKVVGDVPSGSDIEPGVPTFFTPQEFYAEVIRHPDVHRILEALDD